MTRAQARPAPPPEIVAATERDYGDMSHELAALIEASRAARFQHHTELDLFMHLYATRPPNGPTPRGDLCRPSPSYDSPKPTRPTPGAIVTLRTETTTGPEATLSPTPAGPPSHDIGLTTTADPIIRVMPVLPRYFDLIQSGIKTIEVRVAYPANEDLAPGRLIRFTCEDRECVVRVQRVNLYATFQALLDQEGVAAIDPTVNRTTLHEALRAIYPPDKEALGVLGIQIERVQDQP